PPFPSLVLPSGLEDWAVAAIGSLRKTGRIQSFCAFGRRVTSVTSLGCIGQLPEGETSLRITHGPYLANGNRLNPLHNLVLCCRKATTARRGAGVQKLSPGHERIMHCSPSRPRIATLTGVYRPYSRPSRSQ